MNTVVGRALEEWGRPLRQFFTLPCTHRALEEAAPVFLSLLAHT
jgi:hypothetical protein